jgi:tetratricopeptide (TPR) repeat protein
MANFEYGVLALESGNTSSALAHFNHARNTNPFLYSFVDNTQLSVEMASLVMQNGQYERALAMYQEIEETQGLTTQMKLDIGVCYKNIGQPEDAYDYLVAFQKEYPNDLRGMEKMSELYIDLGRKNDAIEELNRILKYFPEHSNRDGINRAIQALREAR